MQADFDRGHVDNHATVIGTSDIDDPENPGEKIKPTDDDDVTVNGPAHAPGLALTKSTDDEEFVLGQTISYDFTLENTGDVTLSGVEIDDQLVGMSDISYTWPGANGAPQPGETATATATYVATQADVDRGFVLNVATAQGTPPNDPATGNPVCPRPPRLRPMPRCRVLTPFPASNC